MIAVSWKTYSNAAFLLPTGPFLLSLCVAFEGAAGHWPSCLRESRVEALGFFQTSVWMSVRLFTSSLFEAAGRSSCEFIRRGNIFTFICFWKNNVFKVLQPLCHLCGIFIWSDATARPPFLVLLLFVFLCHRWHTLSNYNQMELQLVIEIPKSIKLFMIKPPTSLTGMMKDFALLCSSDIPEIRLESDKKEGEKPGGRK